MLVLWPEADSEVRRWSGTPNGVELSHLLEDAMITVKQEKLKGHALKLHQAVAMKSQEKAD